MLPARTTAAAAAAAATALLTAVAPVRAVPWNVYPPQKSFNM